MNNVSSISHARLQISVDETIKLCEWIARCSDLKDAIAIKRLKLQTFIQLRPDLDFAIVPTLDAIDDAPFVPEIAFTPKEIDELHLLRKQFEAKKENNLKEKKSKFWHSYVETKAKKLQAQIVK